MKRLFAAILTLVLAFSCMTSASACCLWPFGGWWGAGYGGGYGGYSGVSYAPYVPPTAGYYSAAYGSMSYLGTDCCAPACCDPCECGAGGCGPGGCASGSCGGTVAPAGSLKPETDPNFDRSSKEKGTYDDDDQFDRDRLRTRDRELDRDLDPLPGARDIPPRTRTAPVEPDPIDDFRSSPAGSGRRSSEPFGSGADEIKNKPPMDDPADDLPAVEPAPADDGLKLNDSTFFEADDLRPNDQTRTDRPVSLTQRTSGLNEVIAPKRLASRSLPAAPARGKTSFAGKTPEDKSGSKPPVRWISVPLPEGNVRL